MLMNKRVGRILVACGAITLLVTPVMTSNTSVESCGMVSSMSNFLLAGNGNGPGDGTGNGGDGPGDGTGNGPGDCSSTAITIGSDLLAGNGKGKGSGNKGSGPRNGTCINS